MTATVARRAVREVPMLEHSLRALHETAGDKWAGIMGGTGSAKTTTWCWWILKRLREYPVDHACYFLGADFKQLRRGSFRTMRAICNHAGIRHRYISSPVPRIVFSDGSAIEALSARTAEGFPATEIDTLLCEEPQTWENGSEVFDMLVKRLRGSRAAQDRFGTRIQPQARLSFNPPVKTHWLHELIERQWPLLGYRCYRFSVRDNVLMPRLAEYIEALEGRLAPSEWPSVIDGHWAMRSGGAHREFDRDVHGAPPDGIPLGIDTTRPLIWSLDFNVGHMRSVIGQAHTQQLFMDGWTAQIGNTPPRQRYRIAVPGWQRRVLRFVGEIAIDDAGSQTVVRAFVERFGDIARRNGVVLCGDSTGGNRSQIDAITTNWSTIRDGLERAKIRYNYDVIQNGKPLDRILLLDAQFSCGAGYGATVDLEQCPELVADLEQNQWNKLGTDYDKTTDQRRTHAGDAAGYLAVWFRRAALIADARTRSRDPVDFMAR